MADNENNAKPMTLYDFNRTIINQLPPLNKEQIQEAINKINTFKTEKPRFYMLLCRDKNYYTLFEVCKFAGADASVEDFGTSVIECAQNAGCGDILSVDLTENKDAVEIWIRDITADASENDENASAAFCMYLFDYSNGVCLVK